MALAPAAALALLAACATVVDPTPDHDRAAAEIARATGVTAPFRPDADPAALAARAATLIEDGLTPTEAVELGLLRNPLFQAATHEVGLARADLVQAGLLTNPSLAALVRFPAPGGSAELDGGLFGQLADAWQLEDRERVAGEELERRILLVAHHAVRLAAEIRAAYVGTVSARREAAIAAENRDVAGTLVELAEAQLEARAVTVIDVNLARVERAAADLALADAELAAEEAARRLATLLGLPPDALPALAPPPDAPAPPLPPVEALERVALERRLDLRAAEAAVAAARAELDRQRGLVVSEVEVGVGAERADDDWSVGPGVRLELPLFDQNQAQIAKAAEEARRRERLRDAARLRCSAEVRSAHARLTAARAALAVHREELQPRAEEALEQASSSYRLGKTTILPVIEAQRQALAARRDHARRLEQAALALSDVERATGTPFEALLDAATAHDGSP